MKAIGILREFCGIEQVVLAERSGVSRQAISACESGAVFPRRPILKRLDDALVSIMVERLLAGALAAGALREKLLRLDMLELEYTAAIERAQTAEAALARIQGTEPRPDVEKPGNSTA